MKPAPGAAAARGRGPEMARFQAADCGLGRSTLGLRTGTLYALEPQDRGPAPEKSEDSTRSQAAMRAIGNGHGSARAMHADHRKYGKKPWFECFWSGGKKREAAPGGRFGRACSTPKREQLVTSCQLKHDHSPARGPRSCRIRPCPAAPSRAPRSRFMRITARCMYHTHMRMQAPPRPLDARPRRGLRNSTINPL